MPSRCKSSAEQATAKGYLYHYCDAKALYGILESRDLWMGGASFLNDPQEWSWLSRVVEGLINDKYGPLPVRGRDPYRSDIRFLDPSRPENQHRRSHTFIASFSSTADDLSQWRAYADEGAGFCIGFKVSELALAPQQVIYSEELQVQIVQQVFRQEIGNRRKPKLYAPETCIAMLNRLRPIMKSYFYHQEAEWRIAACLDFGRPRPKGRSKFPEDGDIAVRVSKKRLVRYIPLRLSPRSIAEIILGPRQDEFDSVAHALTSILKRSGFKMPIPPRCSDVPYRTG
jgi:hypothetical protein